MIKLVSGIEISDRIIGCKANLLIYFDDLTASTQDGDMHGLTGLHEGFNPLRNGGPIQPMLLQQILVGAAVLRKTVWHTNA